MLQIILTTLCIVSGDSIARNVTLDEITITDNAVLSSHTPGKSVQNIDEHLSRLDKVELIQRGSYAAEATVNSMSTERLSTTIDGMKIFCACTDRMDPVTSYVETSNLSRIALNSGLGNDPQATGNIGGSLDLKLRKVGFDAAPYEVNLQTGYEHNSQLQSYGGDVALSSHKAYLNTGVSWRHAGNYTAGGNEEVLFSQYQKLNIFANTGWQLSDDHIVEGTLIFDKATDVGYPALTMDVKRAQGLISAVNYRQEYFESEYVNRFETKLYYNSIRHEMDDTQRPDVAMHMDMPGRSQTAGLYSLLVGEANGHYWQVNYDLYANRSRAEMTMYDNDQLPMFMLTWPDVLTVNTGVALSDQWGPFRISLKHSWQQSTVTDDEGLRTLRIYTPSVHRSKQRSEGRIALHYQKCWNHVDLTAGLGWGNRTPSVTEAYGYFLYNTVDGYDYLGNPELKNESAFELSLKIGWKPISNLDLTFDGNLFSFCDYIAGVPVNDFYAMTIGASGVKQYQNLPHAKIANLSLTSEWNLTSALRWRNRVTYAYGSARYACAGLTSESDIALPQIAPVQWSSNIIYEWGLWDANLGLDAAADQNRFAEEYGETRTPGYLTLHASVGYNFLLAQRIATSVKIGAENLTDRRFSTYSDWKKIPQKGRNIYVSARFSL